MFAAPGTVVYPIGGPVIASFGYNPGAQTINVSYGNGGYSLVPSLFPPIPQVNYTTEIIAWNVVRASSAQMFIPLSSGIPGDNALGYVPLVLCNGRNCMVARGVAYD